MLGVREQRTRSDLNMPATLGQGGGARRGRIRRVSQLVAYIKRYVTVRLQNARRCESVWLRAYLLHVSFR